MSDVVLSEFEMESQYLNNAHWHAKIKFGVKLTGSKFQVYAE